MASTPTYMPFAGHDDAQEIHADLQRIASAVEAQAYGRDEAQDGLLVWDESAGMYTDESVAAWLNATRNGRCYGVSVPKGAAIGCTKLAANSGIPAPTPGWAGQPAFDAYAGVGPFAYYIVNGYVDPDGSPHVTAIEGDGRFARDGSNGNVWQLHKVIFQRFSEGAGAMTQYISDARLAGMEPHPLCYLPDGTIRPFMLTAVYALGTYGGKAASVSGVRTRTRDVSHDALITICDTAGSGYSGRSAYDDWYVKTMFLMKYATKDSQGVMRGCTDYSLNYAVTKAESGTTRVIIATTNAANLVVGSSVSLGSADKSNSVFDWSRITAISAYDSSNSAVYVDTPSSFTTTTSLKLSTGPWHTGALDATEGDGAITQAGVTSGKEPFKLQGIECAVGCWEVIGDAIVKSTGAGWTVWLNHDSQNEATSVTSNYTSTGRSLPAGTAVGWRYPLYPAYAGGMYLGAGVGASQTTGLCDGTYTLDDATTGERELLVGGNLNNGGNAGLWAGDGGNALSYASWNIGSRLSASGRAGAA